MRGYWKIATLTGALMVVLSVFSSGQVTSGAVTVSSTAQGSMTRHVVDWTSDAGGNVVYEGLTTNGYLKQVEILSSDETLTSPTNEWDVVLLNDMRRDVLAGAGSDISTTATAWSTGSPKVSFPILNTPSTSSTNQVYGLVMGRLTLKVTNAGAARKGRIALYFDRYR